jgi:phosphate transport system substrate-binding protein
MKVWHCIIAGIMLCIACDNNSSSPSKQESISSGQIHISVDESFEPVISEQIKVFESAYPTAKVIAEYKTEADCLRDFQKDSTRMIIISRGLSDKEEDFYIKKLEYKPTYVQVATDAIAVVINSTSNDSVFTMAQLKDMLAGKGEKPYNVVVDGKGLTSTVRFLVDSVLKGQSLGKNVTAAKNSKEVINYIAATPNAIGFVGVSWLTLSQDENKELASKVKIALIECKNCEKDVYAKPSQQTILFGQYPLVRGLYYVLKENFAGVGSGFTNFLSLERGQLIFSRANIVPSIMQFNRRRSQIKESE